MSKRIRNISQSKPILNSVVIEFQNALAFHQRGQVAQAQALYEKILNEQPNHFDALHLLGVIFYQTKYPQRAIDLIDRAININPNNAIFYSNRGNVLQDLKQFDAAIASYDKAIQLKPDYADAYSNRGNALQNLKKFDAAIASYDEAIQLKPDYAEAYSNRGNALKDLEKFDAAIASYDRAIQLKADYAEAYSNRGNALQDLKQFDAAVANYDKAILLNPSYATAYSNRGNALKDLKQFDAAVASYDRAIELKPDYAEAYYNRGNALQDLKQFDTAVASYDKAIQLNPGYAEAYSNRGNALKDLKQSDAAVASYDKAIQLKSGYADAYSNRGNALQDLKQFDAAIASYDKAIQLKPDYAEAYSNRGNALKDLNQLDAAVASYDRAIQLKPDYADAYSNRGNALQDLKQLDAAVASYDKAIQLKPDFDYLFGGLLHTRMRLCDWKGFESNVAELIKNIGLGIKASASLAILALTSSLLVQRKSSEIWVNDTSPFNPSLGPIPKLSRSNKIRVGYFSADFREHPVSNLMAELFEIHDRSRFEIIAFSSGPDTDHVMRQRLVAAFDKFIDVTSHSDSAVAVLSRNLKIDIAVDLGGHTANSRIGIFAFRAAPIQVSYIGYIGTLGADYIDYLIADKTVIPKQSRRHYSERIVYLPNTFQVNDRKKVISDKKFTREELGLPIEGFVFCCFNNNYKITPSVFDSWVRILTAVNGSVLWLAKDYPTSAANLYKEAEVRGLDPNRLVFSQRKKLPEYLASYQVADLFLDTLPYNAGTTASDALWAGLPVLTCIGESFASRMAASLLTAINLPELITNTRSEYEDLAIELATNPTKYNNIKSKLAMNRLTTPLFDTPLFARHLEGAYTKMYERYQDDLLPDHMEIKQ